MVRYDFPGKRSISTLLVAPILIPEVVLAVALLLFLQFLSMPKSFGLLLMGHVVFTLPFVVLVVQAVQVEMEVLILVEVVAGFPMEHQAPPVVLAV